MQRSLIWMTVNESSRITLFVNVREKMNSIRFGVINYRVFSVFTNAIATTMQFVHYFKDRYLDQEWSPRLVVFIYLFNVTELSFDFLKISSCDYLQVWRLYHCMGLIFRLEMFLEWEGFVLYFVITKRSLHFFFKSLDDNGGSRLLFFMNWACGLFGLSCRSILPSYRNKCLVSGDVSTNLCLAEVNICQKTLDFDRS